MRTRLYDQLERRRLLAGASLDSDEGVLTVTGTASADTVTLAIRGSRVQLGLNGDYSQYLLASVQTISIDLLGGDDQLRVYSGVPAVSVLAGGGNDVIIAGEFDDSIRCGDGDDTVTAAEGNDTVWGDEGNDRLHGNGGNDDLYGVGGANRLVGGFGDDSLYGGIDDDILSGDAGIDWLDGQPGNDLILGGEGFDYLTGGVGDDTMNAGGGGDGCDMRAGFGNDRIFGGEGDNYLSGDEGDDFIQLRSSKPAVIYGQGGDDFITAGAGDDTIDAEDGNDTINGGGGNDSLDGGRGADSLIGGDGNDDLVGDDDHEFPPGDDTLVGSAGDDSLSGGPGDDRLEAGGGNDSLLGGLGADRLAGGSGMDCLWGGGNGANSTDDDADDLALDTLFGNAGGDRFLQRHSIDDDLAADRAADDAVVTFVDADGTAWHNEHIAEIDLAFRWAQRRTGNAALLKLAGGGDLRFVRVRILGLESGLDILADNKGDGVIRFADLAFRHPNNVTATTIHEFAHNFDAGSTNPSIHQFRALSGWRWNGQRWTREAGAGFASEYGKTNPFEDFATCVEAYHQQGAMPSAKRQYIATFLDGLTT